MGGILETKRAEEYDQRPSLIDKRYQIDWMDRREKQGPSPKKGSTDTRENGERSGRDSKRRPCPETKNNLPKKE